ncbi:MAG: multidrug effflux MFS transporter [Bauldia sp.]|uniref:multidrug effflux MFS transporter n=1 Tax=Bauldia sp. TaxID=2575872 RepID=UPI001D4CF2FB|nr:multidrug effflux MFS transporter [Bauldia sp.]MCB1494229.1 multidrug effflux MFS transporter [Bauldia sp.]
MSGFGQRQVAPSAFIAILIAVSALNPIAVNMFVPAMPDIMRGLGTDQAGVQLVLSAYLFATAGSQLVLGPLSDRFGRRPVLLAGLAAFIAATIACATADSITILVVARIAQGAGGCVGIVLGRAMIRDRYDRDDAASMLGYVTMGFAMAPMVGPVIGGVLNDTFGWRSIFALQTGLGIAVAIACFLFLPETNLPTDRSESRQTFRHGFMTLVRIPQFWAYALACAFGTSVFFSFLGGTPFVAVDMLGMTGTEYGLYFILVPGGFLIGNFLTARYSRRTGIFFMILAGSTVTFVAVLGMAMAFLAGWYHPLALFVPMYAIGFANGLTLANALAGAVSVRPELAGAASGMAGSMQIGFGAIATVLIGALLAATHSVFPLTICMGVLALSGIVAAMWTRTARDQSREHSL